MGLEEARVDLHPALGQGRIGYLCPVCRCVVTGVAPVRGKEDAIICRDGEEHVIVERWTGDSMLGDPDPH